MNITMYDIVIAAVLLVFLFLGYRKGFFLTLCDFLAVFAALIGAMIISDLLAGPVMHFILPLVEKGVMAQLDKFVPDASQAVESIELPAVLTALSQSALYRGFVESVREFFASQAAAAAGAVVTSVAEYIALQIARTVLFALSFVAVLIAWKVASRVLNLAFRLPVLNTLNTFGGAAVGFLQGAVILFIAAALLKDRFLPPEAVTASPLLHFFCTTNPLDFIR